MRELIYGNYYMLMKEEKGYICIHFLVVVKYSALNFTHKLLFSGV